MLNKVLKLFKLKPKKILIREISGEQSLQNSCITLKEITEETCKGRHPREILMRISQRLIGGVPADNTKVSREFLEELKKKKKIEDIKNRLK